MVKYFQCKLSNFFLFEKYFLDEMKLLANYLFIH